MKVKINLHEVLEAEIGSDAVHIPATVEIDELLEFTGIDEHEIDVHDLLAERKAIALIWDSEMLLSHYPHLDQDQAWDVLQICEAGYSAEHGLTWDDISELISEKYPDAASAKQRLADQIRSLLRQLEALPADVQSDSRVYGEISAKLDEAEQAVREAKP